MSTDPLDILLPPTGELLGRTTALLKAAGVEHGALMLQADVSQNVAITDGHSVFVKVYRRKDGLLEPRNTLIAQAHGARAPQLLTHTDWCSVWAFVPLSPLPLAELPAVLASVRQVHDSTRGQALIEEMDYGFALDVVRGRLKKLGDHALVPLVSDLTEELCTRLASDTAGMDLVFTHSDLQFRNLGMSPEGPMVFDWEICKLAPVELELSKLEENLFTGGSWRPGMVAEAYGAPVDEGLLRLATQLRYAQNIAFFLERGDEAVADRQIEALGRFQALV